MQNYNVRFFYQLQNSTRQLQNNNLFFAQLRNSNSSELQNSNFRVAKQHKPTIDAPTGDR